MKILFVNTSTKSCGIYQYGNNLIKTLNKSKDIELKSIDASGLEQVDSELKNDNYDVIIFNYYHNLVNYINFDRKYFNNHICIAILHEIDDTTFKKYKDGFFQKYLYADPTLSTDNPIVTSINRIIPKYENKYKMPSIPTIGSMGFGYERKGYDLLIDQVQKEFDEAIIRLHIPSNGVIDASGSNARSIVNKCKSQIRKKGISIEASHEFLSHEGVLDFLAKNSINAFFYKQEEADGISSSTDHAITVRRPLSINKTPLFKHLHNLNPSILIENNSLKQILSNGTKPFDSIYKDSSEEVFVLNLKKIINDLI